MGKSARGKQIFVKYTLKTRSLTKKNCSQSFTSTNASFIWSLLVHHSLIFFQYVLNELTFGINYSCYLMHYLYNNLCLIWAQPISTGERTVTKEKLKCSHGRVVREKFKEGKMDNRLRISGGWRRNETGLESGVKKSLRLDNVRREQFLIGDSKENLMSCYIILYSFFLITIFFSSQASLNLTLSYLCHQF